MDTVRLIPLGGVGEIGKNMLAVQSGKEIIVIDAGLMFPDEETPGVDIIIPDMSFLTENREHVLGIFLTHGHEDHIGAIPYALRDLDVPVYGTKLTLGLVRPKLAEHEMSDERLKEVAPGDVVGTGPFEVEFIQVSHSIPDACSLAIRTPAGVLIHTSDFKFDPTPVDGRLTDTARFAEYGTAGVLALLSDSTNVEKPGFAESERMLSRTFDNIFASAPGRVIVACFASNIHRVQQVADISMKYGRQMCVIGRSMAANVETARRLGYLDIPDWALLPVEQLQQREASKITIMTTGSQGEPLSVLSRVSMDDHKRIKIEEGDIVVISAKPIPGNENLVMRVINNLFRRGARVIYDDIEPVHVSGHARKEELRLMLNIVKPKYVVPVHGETRHLFKYREMAIESGYDPANIFQAEVGQILELGPESAGRAGEIERAGSVMVDGLGVGDVGTVALRDRWHLASDGVLVAVITIDQSTGDIVGGPDLLARGFMDEDEEFLAEARSAVVAKLDEIPDDAVKDIATAKLEIRSALAKFVNSRLQRRPVIIPVVMEL